MSGALCSNLGFVILNLMASSVVTGTRFRTRETPVMPFLVAESACPDLGARHYRKIQPAMIETNLE